MGLASGYDPSGEVDLHGHAGSAATYAALVATSLAWGRLTGRALPERSAATDLVLGGVATHKLSRLLTKASVASPLRAPFTEFDDAAGAAEHLEHARSEPGVRRTIGELVTCPFCMAVWISTAYVGGLALAPRQARTAAAVLSVVALSDWLQLGYEVLRERAV